jgi:anti-anti-sigma factor
MTSRGLEAAVRHQDGVAVIDLRGEINAAAQDALDAAYAEAMKDDAPSVLLNFKDVDYINSTGIALIVSLLARSRATGARVLASGLSDHFQEIFTITRLTDFMSLFQDEDSAMADVRESAQRSATEQ